jgi:alpha-soluble NSF attachment protein
VCFVIFLHFSNQAEKKASASGGFLSGVFGGGSSYRFEEAAELYIQAANAFRLQKEYRSAGQSFEKAAQCQQKTESKDDAANTLVEAYKSYRSSEPQDAVRVLEQAIHLFTLRGQFRRAANYQMDLGEVYESELSEAAKAIEAYDNAGEWFSQDQAESLSNKAFLKAADLSALQGSYSTAVERYERVAKQSLNSPLSKWSLKEYFLKSTLCRIAEKDTIAAERSLDQYIEWDNTFGTTKEGQLCQDLINAVKEGDEQEYTNKLWAFDQFSKLDKWKVTITLRIKEQIHTAEDDLL